MAQQHQTFAVLLDDFVQQDGRHVRQLSQATGDRFGPQHQVPHNTISRWLRGEVKKPRNWSDIVKLSAVLQLSDANLESLLQSAGHDATVASADPHAIPGLFDQWQTVPNTLSPFQAPPQPSTFVGRVDIVQNLERYFASKNKHRLACLLGMRGVGKTTLATYLAYQLREQFPDGILWVDLAKSNMMSALQAVVASYGEDVSQFNDSGTCSSKVRELLATKTALLVLDNAQDDESLRMLLPPTGQCAVLITSYRHNLAVTSDAYRLYLQSFNQQKDESAALFGRILGQELVEAEIDLYQQIAATVGHLPLAVNILAQRLRHEPGWTTSKLLARLQRGNRLDLLVWGDQQIRHTFNDSYRQLDESDQNLFALLSLFPGSFTAIHAAQIANRPLWEVEDNLRHLHNYSLLNVEGENRYVLHPLVRDFSREQPQDDAWPFQFVETYTAAVQQEDDLTAEQHNIIAAIQLANKHGLAEAEITAVIAFYPYLQTKGQLEQAAELLQKAESTARKAKDLSGLMHILHHSGYTAMKQGFPNQAESYYQEAFALAQQLDEPGQTAEIMLKLGALAYRRGRIEESQQLYSEALPLARQGQNQHLIAALLTNLGLVEAAKGSLTQAISHYEEALSIAREAGEDALAINILQNLGDMQEERGDYAQAKCHYEEGLALAKLQKDPELRSRMLGNLGTVVCQLGNYSEAAAYFRQGLALAEANGLSIQVYRQQANLGQAATLRGQFRQANAHYQEALALARELNYPEDLGMILNQAGESFLAQDAYLEAGNCFSEALHLAENSNLLRIRPLSLFGLARIAAVRGNIDEARQLGKQSREQLIATGYRKANEVWWWLQELPGETPPD